MNKILAPGINHSARHAVKAKFTGALSMSTHYIGLVSPSLTRRQVNGVELPTNVRFLLFDVDLTQRY